MSEQIDSDSNGEPSPEMMPRLSKADYEAEVKTIAERLLRELATDTGALTAFDTVDVRALLGETETIYERFPFSVLEHGKHEPGPDAWPWINDAVPKDSLQRQALDVLAGDTYYHAKQFVQSGEYTYRQDGTTYVREGIRQSETENTAQEADDSNDGTDGTDSTDDASDNPAVDEHAPEWGLPTDDEGEPDYEAAIEQVGLEYDQLFNIGTDYYRYRGRRGDDIMVASQSEYADLTDDALAIPFVWAAYCEGDIGHGPPLTGRGMVRGVTNATGNSHIGLKPSDWDTDSSFARIGLENVPERGAFFVDYRYGEDLPALTLYDATEDDSPAYQFLLPTREYPTVQLVCDRESNFIESLPAELRERIESTNEHETESGNDGANQ